MSTYVKSTWCWTTPQASTSTTTISALPAFSSCREDTFERYFAAMHPEKRSHCCHFGAISIAQLLLVTLERVWVCVCALSWLRGCHRGAQVVTKPLGYFARRNSELLCHVGSLPLPPPPPKWKTTLEWSELPGMDLKHPVAPTAFPVLREVQCPVRDRLPVLAADGAAGNKHQVTEQPLVFGTRLEKRSWRFNSHKLRWLAPRFP